MMPSPNNPNIPLGTNSKYQYVIHCLGTPLSACLEVGFGNEKYQFFDEARRFLKCISAQPRRTKKATKHHRKSDDL